ncbi:DUF3039 domain-containing protein [Galbitalea sp. SE-J8]|uniref:DUF3039 domain-containing protein n=1 Tax=Galbitalea sp. SE-J8 TaxID=3054952 RepID=UPI00259D11E4|nr:DUF3039 domain-containing protein [Galbitalea sp. SE-J8]MDM4763645.1 DUF3039 domain-containing protein [Galbitalea sp. SE-J8]
MSLSRHGRPTLRVLRDDLGMAISSEGLDPHSPLIEIDHPIIKKAAESFGADPAADLHEGPIRSSRRNRLLEIKQSQWRGGVWIDDATGEPWLVAAGIAKGDHKDHDDFYQRLARADESGATDAWLPTDADKRQLRREAAAMLVVEWELTVQRAVLAVLKRALGAREITFSLPHPKSEEPDLGTVTVTVDRVRDPDYDSDDLLVEIDLVDRHKGSRLGWTAELRVLTTLEPRQMAWDSGGGIYSPKLDAGRLDERVAELQRLVDANELAAPVPNELAHYSHRRNLAEATVEGKGVRSLCGQYFVPTRDHETTPRCPVCEERFSALP